MKSLQEKVLRLVSQISRGKVSTYKEIAKEAGSPRAWRVVGNILNKSASWRTKIPCHRVIRSDTRAKRSVEMKTKSSSTGEIGGYRYGTKRKIALLKKEGIIINSHGKATQRFRK